jgi:hypothetical protein
MQVHVDQVADIKTGQYGVSSKVVSGKDHYFVNEDATQYIGKDLEMEISEKTSAKGNKYKIGKILGTVQAASGNGNGHVGISWDDYRNMAEAAHSLAMKLEPDGTVITELNALPITNIDRSTARAAILNTVMIAYSNGKIFIPEEDMPF